MSLGTRIQVVGQSCSGKSTLAAELARRVGADFVELDALNWLPGWVGLHQSDPGELERRVRAATRGSAWVLAGNYRSFTKPLLWERLETIIWLDLPMALLLIRVIRRSWRRYRSGELLWGTNRERFWPQLLFWKGDSLLYWVLTTHRRRRHELCEDLKNRDYEHIRFVRLRSTRAIRRFSRSLTA